MIKTIPERKFFVYESAPGVRTYHLNLTPLDSGFWNSQLAFRDYLLTDVDVAVEYVKLKKRLAEEYAKSNQFDRDGKTAFVAKVLQLSKSAE